MKFLLGKKEYMTQMFDEQGNAYPVTVVSLGDTVVTQLKSKEKDGYSAVQVGFGVRRDKSVSKAQAGHVKKAKEANAELKNPGFFREFAVEEADLAGYTLGMALPSDAIEAGMKVRVVATSKSKGFQGVVKRHGFHGGPRSHGQKHSERAPGSLGMAGVQRVFKGKRTAGRMGGERITTRNLKIAKVDAGAKELYIHGSVPGVRGTLLMISA